MPKAKKYMGKRHVIPEPVKRPGRRLGRHLHHDVKSRQYPVRDLLDMKAPLQTKVWDRSVEPFDQGHVGSCTGNACLGMLATTPYYQPEGWKGIAYDEATALKIYSLATEVDDFGGTYPPNDSGSSTLGVLKAAQQLGWIDSYLWGFGIDDVLQCLSQKGPMIIGTHWYESMFHPNPDGTLTVTGAIEGGHEYELIGIDVENQWVIMENSWASAWGVKGQAYIRYGENQQDLQRLLQEGGEAGYGVRA